MNNKLFVDIYGNVGNNIQDASTGTQSILKNYCNDIYLDLLRRVNWNGVNESYTFPTVAGTSDYVLPSNFGKEIYVYNSTIREEILPISLQELIRDFVDTLGVSGDIRRYTIIDKPCRSNPSSASQLAIVSSSAADTTQTVFIVGIDSNDVQLSESVTLTGTTQANSVNSYKGIRSITKSATTTGRITITSNSAAVTVAILAPADKSYFVKAIRFNLIPSSVQTIAMPYIIDPYPLVNDYDKPVIDCANIIELGATMMAWRYKRQFQKAAEYERQYERAIDTLIWNTENSMNQVHNFGYTPYPRNDY